MFTDTFSKHRFVFQGLEDLPPISRGEESSQNKTSRVALLPGDHWTFSDLRSPST